MNNGGWPDQGDMFPETFSEPSRDFRAVLNDPDLVGRIARIKCLDELTPILRGDGKKVGHSIITYGLPAWFPVTISHPHTPYLAELAGIVPRKKTLGVKFNVPCEKDIAAEMRRIRPALRERLRKAADSLSCESNP